MNLNPSSLEVTQRMLTNLSRKEDEMTGHICEVRIAHRLNLVLFIVVVAALCIFASREARCELEEYYGPKKRIAVLDFEVKAPKAGKQVGGGMSEMLVNALVETQRFIVLERTRVDQILKEQSFNMSGAVKPGTEAKTGEMLGSQLLIKGVITEFKEKESGKGLGALVKGVAGGIGMVESHVGLTIRIFDASTGVIMESHSVDKKVKKMGLAAGAKIKGVAVGGGLFKSKSMQDAIEQAIGEAVDFIVSKMKNVPWQGRVVSADEFGQVYVNAGTNLGMKAGDNLDVYKKGKELIDPETGLSLGSQTKKIGCVKIETVEEKFSIAEVVSGSGGRAKDIVKFSSGCVPGEVDLSVSHLATTGKASEVEMPKPRIMVVIPEVHISRQIPDPAGETEIIRKFLEAGYDVVDQNQIKTIRYNEKVLNAVKDSKAAVALGLEYGAEIIVVGEAFSEFAGRTGDMTSCRARVEARAIKTDVGNILVADGKHGSGLDRSENVAAKIALRNAGAEIADYFIVQITEKLEKQVTGPATAQILLTGVDFSKLTKFETSVQEIGGVQRLHRRNFSGGVARIEVEFEGDAQGLANAIVAKDFGELKVEITGSTANKLDIKIGK